MIFSSHILSEVQAICEQVLIISKGKLVAFDTPDNLEKLLTQSNEIHFRIQASVPEAKAILENMEQLTEWRISEEEDGSILAYAKSDSADTRNICCSLFFAFAQKELPIFEMTSKKVSLEDVFIELTESEVPEE